MILDKVSNCRCPSSTVLCLVNHDRHPTPVLSSETEEVRSAEAGRVFLERGHPRFELATTLLVPVSGNLRVDHLANDLAGMTTCSIRKPTRSTLKKYQRQSSKVELMTKCGARDTNFFSFQDILVM